MTSNTALLSAAAHAMLSSDLLPNVNLSNWEKLVTDDEFRDFMKLVEKYKYPNHTQETTLPKCHDYCTGELYQMLRTYNGVHGYVALLVSVTKCETISVCFCYSHIVHAYNFYFVYTLIHIHEM